MTINQNRLKLFGMIIHIPTAIAKQNNAFALCAGVAIIKTFVSR